MFPYLTGSAREKITPSAGIPLGGNARTDYYATHVVHDIYVRALYVKSGATAVCILSVELLGLYHQDAKTLREQVAAAINIPPQNVMIASTHTHSAPDLLRLFCSSEEKISADRETLAPWMSTLFTQSIAAARSAVLRAVPSRLHLDHTQNLELQHNRRLRLHNGETVMNWTMPAPDTVAYSWGPTDPQLTLAAFYTADNDLSGAIMHYALHPAILAGQNLGISGDFCGLAMQLLEQEHVPSDTASVLFLNGALGNINHIDYRHPERGRNLQEVERCATSLASLAGQLLHEGRLNTAPQQSDNAAIMARFNELFYPIRDISEEQLDSAKMLLAHSGEFTMAEEDGVPPEMEARRTLQLYELKLGCKNNNNFTAVENGKVVLGIQVIRIGQLILSALPAEMFVEHGLELKSLTNNPFALMICPANGYVGYIPTVDAFAQGGYEPGLGPGYLPEWAADELMQELLKMQSHYERNSNEK